MVPTASPSHPPASMCSASFSSMRRWSSDQSNFYLLFLFFIIILFAWRPEFGLLPLPVWKTNFNIMPVPEIRLAICTIFSPEADSDNEEVVQQLKPNCIPLCAKALTGPVTARSLSTMRWPQRGHAFLKRPHCFRSCSTILLRTIQINPQFRTLGRT